MMDANVKPGDRGRRCSCGFILAVICRLFCFILMYPFILVFFVPVTMGLTFYKMGKTARATCLCNVILFFFGFIFFGLPFNICFIPMFLVFTLCLIVVWIFKCCAFCCRLCRPNSVNSV